jgi:hypothetical protein
MRCADAYAGLQTHMNAVLTYIQHSLVLNGGCLLCILHRQLKSADDARITASILL